MLTLWPERVSLSPDFLLLLARSLSGTRVRSLRGTVTPRCRRALLFLRRLGLKPDFRLVALRIGAPGCLGPKEIHDAVDRAIEGAFGRFCAQEDPYFRQAVRSYLARNLWTRLARLDLTLVQYAVPGSGGRHRFILSRSPLNAPLGSFLEGRGAGWSQSLSAYEWLKAVLAPLRYVLAGAFAFPRRPAGTADPSVPSVWVQYEPTLVERSWSVLFWRRFVEPRGFQIVVYFDDPHATLGQEPLARLREEGLEWLDLRSPFGAARLTAGDLASLARSFLRLPSGSPLGLRLFRLRFDAHRCLHRRLYEAYSVRMLVQHGESEWMPAAKAAALEGAGGVMMGTHWSSYPQFNLNTHTHPQQVYFAWGRMMREALALKGHAFRHLLPSGVWLLPDTEAKRPVGLRPGLSFTIAAFDSAAGLEAHQSPTDLGRYWLALVRLLEENPDWGVLFKGKYPAFVKGAKFGGGVEGLQGLPWGREIVRRLAPLVEDGRFAFIDRLVSPPTASARADLTVCFGINSPGVIAGARGLRAVHWDCGGYRRHPFYAFPGQKSVYPDLETLMDAVRAAARGDRSVGDNSAWRAYIDAFGDDRGPERVGAFVQDYMGFVVGGEPAGAALEKAVAGYKERNRAPADFEEDSGLWLREP